MNLQLLCVIALIAGAGLYVLRFFYQSLNPSGKGGCSSGCGKCAAPAEEKRRPGMISLEQVPK